MHATLHCSCLNRAPSLSWASLYFLLIILDTFPTLKMHVRSQEETSFAAAGSSLVLVGWAGTFVCRLEWNKTSGCYLQPQSKDSGGRAWLTWLYRVCYLNGLALFVTKPPVLTRTLCKIHKFSNPHATLLFEPIIPLGKVSKQRKKF